MAVYIASTEPLPLVPWDETAPALHVKELSGDPDVRVRAQFEKPYVVYAGSHEGCGCGFFKLRDAAYYEPREIEACRESLDRLAQYLETAMGRAEGVELYTSWEGDQGKPPEIRREVTPAQVRNGDLEDHERQHCRVVAS